MQFQQTIFMTDLNEREEKAEEDLVPPVYILQGQVLVREGETISSDVYNQLKLVGLLEKGTAFNLMLD